MEAAEFIHVDELKNVSFLRNNDLYRLACLVLELNEAKDTGTSQRTYQTVHGLAVCYADLISVSSKEVEAVMNKAGLSSRSTIVNSNDVIPQVGMTYKSK